MKYDRTLAAAAVGFIAMVIVGYAHSVLAAPTYGPSFQATAQPTRIQIRTGTVQCRPSRF